MSVRRKRSQQWFGMAVVAASLGLAPSVGVASPTQKSLFQPSPRPELLEQSIGIGAQPQARGLTKFIPCLEYEFEDPARDTTSTIDIVKYSLRLDCRQQVYEIRFRAGSSFRDSRLGYASIAFDRDLNKTNNCGGVDREVAVTYSSSRRGLIAGIIRYGGSCSRATVSPVLRLTRLSPSREVAMVFSASELPRANFDWFAYASNDPDASGRRWDALPNRGYHDARSTNLPVLEPESSLFPLNSAVDGIVPGHFVEGSDSEEVLFYNKEAPDWFSEQGAVRLDGYDQVVAGDFDGDGNDEVLGYTRGDGPDHIYWQGFAVDARQRINLDGTYRVAVGDFNGSGEDDIALIGDGPDAILYGSVFRIFGIGAAEIADADERVTVGDFDGDGHDDVIAWKSGPRTVELVRGATNGMLPLVAVQIGGPFRKAAAGDFNGDHIDDVFFTDGGSGRDEIWFGKASSPYFRRLGAARVDMMVSHAVAGDFNGDGSDDLFMAGPEGGYSITYFGPTLKPTLGQFEFPTATIGEPYSFVIPMSGAHPPLRISIAPRVPGLLLDSATGVLAGAATGPAGTLLTKITVADAFGNRLVLKKTIVVA